MQVNHHRPYSGSLVGKFHMSQIAPSTEQLHSGFSYENVNENYITNPTVNVTEGYRLCSE